MTTPESCGCMEEWEIVGQVTRFSKIESSACLYPATVERLKEADKAIDELFGHLRAKDAEILRIGKLHAQANEESFERYQRLRIAEETLKEIAGDGCQLDELDETCTSPVPLKRDAWCCGCIAREALERIGGTK